MMIVFLVGGFFILIGLGFFFARDLLWEADAFGKQIEGYAVERSDLWEFGANVRGVLLIGAGVIFILMGVMKGGEDTQVNNERAYLENTFGSAIAEWRDSVNNGEMDTVYKAEREGVEQILYGRCGYSDFAAIISNYHGKDYLYTTAKSISTCNLDNTRFWMSDDLGEGWYRGTTISPS
jgi:hypothetical protein